MITLHPGFNVLYYGFYIEGLRRVFGVNVFRLSRHKFPDVGEWQLAFIAGGRKVVIAAEDSPVFVPALLDWCDIYAKVNIDADALPDEYRNKILSIAPSFGVRIAPVGLFFQSVIHSPELWHHPAMLVRRLRQYAGQYRYRLPLHAHSPAQADDAYLFFIASIWKREQEGANRARAAYIEAVRASGIPHTAGFAPRSSDPVLGYEALTLPAPVPYPTYYQEARRSTVVFNTPAVESCHGWKLGEYLAWGKCILSTPLTRSLPAPLVHGQHIHIVEPSAEAINDGLRYLLDHPDYRHALERYARAWWDEYGTPAQVIRRIMLLPE